MRMADITDPIAVPADIDCPHGKAWRCNLTEGHRINRIRPDDDATLVHWIIEAPWAHPAWHSYSLVLIHLRPLPEGRSSLIYLPGASHEMWLFALDPKRDRRPLIASCTPDRNFMEPANFMAQFIARNDEGALSRIERAVEDICDGRLSPDTDFRREWIARFGDNMVKGLP